MTNLEKAFYAINRIKDSNAISAQGHFGSLNSYQKNQKLTFSHNVDDYAVFDFNGGIIVLPTKLIEATIEEIDGFVYVMSKYGYNVAFKSL